MIFEQVLGSSQIAAMAHNSDTSEMFIKFHTGAVYKYLNVPTDIYTQIRNAESVGSTFNKLVKCHPTVYPYSKV